MRLEPIRQIFYKSKIYLNDTYLYQFYHLNQQQRLEKIPQSLIFHLAKYKIDLEMTLKEFYCSEYYPQTELETFYDWILNRKSYSPIPKIRLIKKSKQKYYLYQDDTNLERNLEFEYLPYSQIDSIKDADFIIFGATNQEFIIPFHPNMGCYFEYTDQDTKYSKYFPYLPNKYLFKELVYTNCIELLEEFEIVNSLNEILDFLNGQSYYAEIFYSKGFLIPLLIPKTDIKYVYQNNTFQFKHFSITQI